MAESPEAITDVFMDVLAASQGAPSLSRFEELVANYNLLLQDVEKLRQRISRLEAANRDPAPME